MDEAFVWIFEGVVDTAHHEVKAGQSVNGTEISLHSSTSLSFVLRLLGCVVALPFRESGLQSQ